MSKESFRFKQFEVFQDSCAMKVGTDGVLLGAWSGYRGRVLDVGTGTGVIALMLAQRGATEVDAIEIDADAAAQAASNFAISPWSDILRVTCDTFQQYAASCDKRYDTIVSNPPYFINSLKSPQQSRLAARHTQMLPYEDLARGVVSLLKEDGEFFAIFPYEESNIFVALAALEGLFLNSRVEVRPVTGRAVKRVMLGMSLKKSVEVEQSTLVIASDQQRSYTDSYRELTKDFYIKF